MTSRILPESASETARTAYAEPASAHDLAHELARDCRKTAARLRFDRIARAASAPAPSIRYEDFPTTQAKPELRVDVAAQRLADAIFGD